MKGILEFPLFYLMHGQVQFTTMHALFLQSSAKQCNGKLFTKMTFSLSPSINRFFSAYILSPVNDCKRRSEATCKLSGCG